MFIPKINVSIFISQKKCIACEHCVNVCRTKVLGMTYSDTASYASVEYLDRCVGCRICEMLCPTDAIEITSKVKVKI